MVVFSLLNKRSVALSCTYILSRNRKEGIAMQTHQQGKVRVGKLRTTFFSIIVVLIMLLGAAITAVVTTVPAKADTGGYPYPSIACVWSPYATIGTGNWC